MGPTPTPTSIRYILTHPNLPGTNSATTNPHQNTGCLAPKKVVKPVAPLKFHLNSDPK